MAASSQPARIVVVGAGGFGNLHAQTLAGLAEAELAGVVDVSRDALEGLATALPGLACWTDLDAALAEANADGWLVASSTRTHVDIAAKLLASGAIVMVEKPIAESVADARRLGPHVRPDSSNLMMGHIALFNSEFVELTEQAAARGPIRFIDAVRHRPVTTIEDYPGESPLYLTMIHDLYLVRALVGSREPSRIDATSHRHASGAIDLTVATLQFDDGTVARLTASFMTTAGMCRDGYDRLEVFGDDWMARIEPNPRPVRVWDDRAHWPMALEIRTGPGGASGMLAEEQRRFCRIVAGLDVPPPGATYQDTMQMMQWAERIARC